MAEMRPGLNAPIDTAPVPDPKGRDIALFGALASGLWIAVSGFYFLLADIAAATALRLLLTALVIFLPVAMIWVAVTAMRASRLMEVESTRLQAAVDALRNAYVQQTAQKASQPVEAASISKKLDQIAAAQAKTETALATFVSVRAEAARQNARAGGGGEAQQPALELGTPAEALAPPLSSGNLIRALNFPDTAEDEDGFAALRRALKDRTVAQLVQASQDVLTLMSQDGIYMDDLTPEMARPELWRRFAQGERGRAVAGLGGIRDRASLALAAGRMKQDPIFRDSAHHFLRLFDRFLTKFEPEASDTELQAFADTRTSRAFMLLGRVAGIFD